MAGALLILQLPAPPSDGNLGPTTLAQVTKESIDENQNNDSNRNSLPASVATHTRTIGIIHPPPDIRNIVDTTAQFVAKNGPEFEKKIIVNNAKSMKLTFLNASDPYHAYYQHRLSEFRCQSEVPNSAAGEKAPSAAVEKPDSSAQFRTVRKLLEPPEAENYTVRLHEGITREELDIIKLTAQFVARNGESFLAGLTSREINSPQFHFMKPSHSMFMFFTALADAYSKVLMPPKGLTDKLRKNNADRTTVLGRCLNRLEWEKSQEQARQKTEDEIEQEKVQMVMIDWHDFVVVEAVDFADDEDEDEELPAPVNLEEVIRRSKISAMEEDGFVEPGKEVEMEMDEEEKLVSAASIEENDDDEPPMRVVTNWKKPEERIAGERDPTKFAVSPITGELIPIREMSEHMRISLIDPKFKEQKDRMFAKIRETTLANDDEISRNIVGLARTRPDIFGTTEEEVSNAVKSEIEKKNDDQQDMMNYDRRSFPGVPSTRPLPPPVGLALNIPNAVQYATATSSGLFMPPPMQMIMNHPMPFPQHYTLNCSNIPGTQYTPIGFPNHFVMPPPPPPEEAPPFPEEPQPKRQKLNDSKLIPEDQFLSQHPGPAQISISVPNVGEGNLRGQVLEVTAQSLLETIGSLKERISGEIQLPANKQKLSRKAGFLKENLSLAHYNVASGAFLVLSLRERGGRKR